MKTDFDAIVVGAGPAGSSAAILLAQAGWSVALIEKQAFPRRKVCGECVAASNLPLLHALGIGPEFIARAGPELRQTAVMRGARTILADLPLAPDSRYAWGRALGREVLDTMLLERAHAVGAEVFQPWAVQKIDDASGLHRCTARKSGSNERVILEAPVVILAHGSWEPLPADREEQRLARSDSDLLAFKANFSGASLTPGLLPVLLFHGGYGGMVLAGDGLTTLACCVRADRLDALRRSAPGKPAGEVIEAMLKRECRGVEDALLGAMRQGTWMASGPLAPGIRLKSEETVFRIGNAAGEAHPIIGEGMSMALQSAWLLCEKLMQAGQTNAASVSTTWQRAVCNDYAAQWRKKFVPRMRLASTFAYVAMRPATSAALLIPLTRWPSLITLGAIWAGKVNCPASIASTDDRFHGAIDADTCDPGPAVRTLKADDDSAGHA
ncbi:NAD(P)/FAD-dependent oxidoreductase [Pusillimonas sp. ANT_WB101]|uniref:NAD(P)/FAD-dependent oxidoreductase n=1 Tax=Pusillimonas sp. ANT_WB101 TaxID=2597356 RepID=UPI0011EF4322|nr:NAD(P)/FAD-dependent oxidoreductase [Pusillimonas sp. ANT_WB101]KAA0911183.1 NAD(P)/FAD-dependent oxidoreductase [Pusillimonas sp. ANT_WB101]